MPETEEYVRPALYNFTTSVNEAVKISMDSTLHSSIPPESVPTFFERTIERFPDNPALSFKNQSGEWETLTYSQYKSKIRQVAKVFIKFNLQPHDTVSAVAFNCPEWFYSELGAIYAGGIIAGIYTTNSPEAIFHILSTSQSKILIVDDIKQMKKVREIWSRLPNLKSVIQINGPFETDLSTADGYYKWSDIEQIDTSYLDEELEYRIRNIAVNECCMLIYTSGTVGFPKAAMVSHDNIIWDVKMVDESYGNVVPGQEVSVSYLPMSHIAAQLVDVFSPILQGGCVYFADRDALKGTLIKSLTKARPTRLLGVPRVFEKIYEQLTKKEAQLSTVKKALLNWARHTALRYHLSRMEGKQSETWMYKLAQHLVLNKIKESLGFDRLRSALIGGAPVSTELKEFFLSLDVPLFEVYGMSESSGGVSISSFTAPNLQTVGRMMPGMSAKIDNWDTNGIGEICIHGRNVFMGYMNDLEKTQEAIDEEGWLHTGDLGRIDEKGYVYITGRLKELIITAGGENIPPVHVENLIKAELPIVSNALLCGDRRKYLTILLTLKTEVDASTGMPKDDLIPEVIQWLRQRNLGYTKVSEIINRGPCPVFAKEIDDGIRRANANSISNAQKVQKFALLAQDFSIATDELGPTLKLKRSFVMKKYQDVIEGLYKE